MLQEPILFKYEFVPINGILTFSVDIQVFCLITYVIVSSLRSALLVTVLGARGKIQCSFKELFDIFFAVS